MNEHSADYDAPRYCRRCDFYTDHVSTAHDGLAERGLLRGKGEGLVVCADCGHKHTPDRCVGDPTPSDLWAGVTPASCDCPGPGQTSDTPPAGCDHRYPPANRDGTCPSCGKPRITPPVTKRPDTSSGEVSSTSDTHATRVLPPEVGRA